MGVSGARQQGFAYRAACVCLHIGQIVCFGHKSLLERVASRSLEASPVFWIHGGILEFRRSQQQASFPHVWIEYWTILHVNARGVVEIAFIAAI